MTGYYDIINWLTATKKKQPILLVTVTKLNLFVSNFQYKAPQINARITINK